MIGDWRNPLGSFDAACRAAQVTFKREPAPGRWVRGDANDGNRRRPYDASTLLFPDKPGGIVWNFHAGLRVIWFADADGRKLTARELQDLRSAAEKAIRRYEAHRRCVYDTTAQFAARILDMAHPANAHPYLLRKRVSSVPGLWEIDASTLRAEYLRNYSNGIYEREKPPSLWDKKAKRPFEGRVLIVPLYDGKDFSRVRSLEFISETGAKLALADGAAGGSFWMPEELRKHDAPPEEIGIAEGLATALSLSQVQCIPVVSARSCGNLKAAALSLLAQFPYARLYVFGDVGKPGDENPQGEIKAREAARLSGAEALFPVFTPDLVERFKALTGSEAPTDWNDFYLSKGDL